jgi:hypothetical protein
VKVSGGGRGVGRAKRVAHDGWLGKARGMDAGLTSSTLQVVQLAITPVILLSGVGALMITLTNRMGRIVDRTRRLAEQVHGASGADRTHFESQLDIMWRRAGLVRLAVTLAGWSMLLSCFLIVVIFVDALLERKFGVEMVIIFAASVGCLIGALVSFLRDIGVSLRALHLEVDRARGR